MSELGRTYDWDDKIMNDGAEQQEIVTLPAGNYPFTVVKAEKGFYNGSDSLPPCNMSTVTLKIDGGALGTGMATERLYLCEKMEWKDAAFLRSLGLKKHGEPIPFGKLADCVGYSGRCKVIVNDFTRQDGTKVSNNRVDKYFDPEEKAAKKEFKAGDF